MLAQLDDISAFPFKCSHKVFVIVIRDVIPYLNFAETYWKPLHISSRTESAEGRLSVASIYGIYIV